MEALAIYDFNATAEDELSFKRGETLLVLQTDRDANWYNAELRKRSGFVPKNYIQMKECPWYQGKITRANAEQQLLKQPHDGAFLIRDSETDSNPGSFSLSVKFMDSVQHFKILRKEDEATKKLVFHIWVQGFDSLNLLVENYRGVSISRSHRIVLTDMVQLLGKARACYDFTRQEDGELQFNKGDVIDLLDTSNSQWWKGQLNGEAGYFPATFVQIL